MDKTYYAGTLHNTASQTFSMVDGASINAIVPPTQNTSTYSIANRSAWWPSDQGRGMVDATSAGYANLYYYNTGNQVAGGYNVTVGGIGGGTTIYQQGSSINIANGCSFIVRNKGQLWIGVDQQGTGLKNVSGNLGLNWGANTYAVQLGASSYLSANGYLGGVADKSQAGATITDAAAALRTNAISTGDDVAIDTAADWGTIGDIDTPAANAANPHTVIGNNKITTGGNVGVFMNASVTVGSNLTMEVGTNIGSGFFIGTGIDYTVAAWSLNGSSNTVTLGDGATGSLGNINAVAGLIKACLCLEHKAVPPQANLKEPNPNIPFEEMNLRLVQDETIPLTTKAKDLYAAINSFGYGGSNANAIIRAPRKEEVCQDINSEKVHLPSDNYILSLSTKQQPSLKLMAERYAAFLKEENGPSIDDICYSVGKHRSYFQRHLVAFGKTKEEIAQKLEDFVQDKPNPDVVVGQQQIKTQTQPAFVFSGMGPQWW